MNFASDLAGSIAVLAGLGLVAIGYDHGDALAALVVGMLIFGAVGRLVLENARVLMDRTPEDARTARARRSSRSSPRSSCGGCACASRAGATSPTSSSR